MPHPPGGEADPDDRLMYMPAEGAYAEDGDAGGVSGEGGPGQAQDGGWSQDQLQVRRRPACVTLHGCVREIGQVACCHVHRCSG